MGWESLAGTVGGGLVGGILGGQGTPGSETSSSNSVRNINLRDFNQLNVGRSGLEENAYNNQVSSFTDLSNLIGAGPGLNEVQANNQFQNSYANQLQQLMQNIANPNQQQNFSTAQQYFAPQQTALNQQFEQQGIASNRLAARLGRAGNDPILRNKLAQEQTRQQTALNSQIGAFGQQLPSMQAQQIMGVGNALSNLRGGLATQAMNNRSTLLNMGQQLTQAERNYRLQTAQQMGGSSSVTDTSKGGGPGGMLGGVLSGAGSLGGTFGQVFSGLGSSIGGLFGAGGAVSTVGSGVAGVGSGAGAGASGFFTTGGAAEVGTTAAVAL